MNHFNARPGFQIGARLIGFYHLADAMTEPQRHSWDAVVAAGVKAQQLVKGAVAVGGTAASLYARHRVSMDDHLLPGLRDSFSDVLQSLEGCDEWKTARVQPPVLILGSIAGVQVGYRQSRRTGPIQTAVHQTPWGPLTVPTL